MVRAIAAGQRFRFGGKNNQSHCNPNRLISKYVAEKIGGEIPKTRHLFL